MYTHSSAPLTDLLQEPWRLHRVETELADSQPLATILEAERALPPETAEQLAARGLFARSRTTADDIVLKAAEELIGRVESLSWLVHRLVRRLYVLNVPDPAYDQSHSEPAYPRTIFVSVPESSEVGALRLAEAVVHEAMHLNLSLFEELVPLTVQQRALYSPWKREQRPTSGIVHGVFVFTCLHPFFRELRKTMPVGSAVSRHLAQRMAEIEEELQLIEWDAIQPHLTPQGQHLIQGLRHTVP